MISMYPHMKKLSEYIRQSFNPFLFLSHILSLFRLITAKIKSTDKIYDISETKKLVRRQK